MTYLEANTVGEFNIHGDITGECNLTTTSKPIIIIFSDNTIIRLDNKGVNLWELNVINKGALFDSSTGLKVTMKHGVTSTIIIADYHVMENNDIFTSINQDFVNYYKVRLNEGQKVMSRIIK